MFQIKDKIENIAENIEEMAKTYYRLSIIHATDNASKLGAMLMVTLLISGVLLFALFFACLGLSWWIGQKLQNTMLGFFIVAGGLLVVLLLILLMKKRLIQPAIRNIIINKIYG